MSSCYSVCHSVPLICKFVMSGRGIRAGSQLQCLYGNNVHRHPEGLISCAPLKLHFSLPFLEPFTSFLEKLSLADHFPVATGKRAHIMWSMWDIMVGLRQQRRLMTCLVVCHKRPAQAFLTTVSYHCLKRPMESRRLPLGDAA